MKKNSRTTKTPKSLGSFSNEVLVKCPHCKKKAIILTTLGKYIIPYPSDTKSVFRCGNCYTSINENLWYGPVIITPSSKKCSNCGALLTYSEKVKKSVNKVAVKCNACHTEQLYDANQTLTYASSTQATDPYFGLPLWLQFTVDENIFWAYNYEHLAYLKIYVSAKLREEGEVSKYSITQMLPDFIKLGKNRGKIINVIERLEKVNFEPV